MALQILSDGPDPEIIVGQIRERIAAEIPDAQIEVHCASPGHFEIRVVSNAFEDLPRVRQHQRVYTAITDLMSGDAPPIHAVDRLETLLP